MTCKSLMREISTQDCKRRRTKKYEFQKKAQRYEGDSIIHIIDSQRYASCSKSNSKSQQPSCNAAIPSHTIPSHPRVVRD